MVELHKTETFSRWLDGLRDLHGRARVQARIERFACGSSGDVRPVGDGVFQMRIDCGPGYRVYFSTDSNESIVLLTGGDKRHQQPDIELAQRLARDLKEGNR